MLATPYLLFLASGLALSPFVGGSVFLYSTSAFACILLLVALNILRVKRFIASRLHGVSCALLSVLFGVSLGVLQIEHQLAKTLPSSLDKQKAKVSVRLDYALSESQQRTLWYATIKHIEVIDDEAIEDPAQADALPWQLWQAKAHGEPIRLAWYGKAKLKAGELWRIELTLRRPRGFVNPKGFDYAAWLLQQGFVATAYGSDAGAERISSEVIGASWVQRINQTLADQLQKQLPEQSPSARFFEGLLLGRRGEVTSDDWLVLQRTGTNHLFAISGLHIGLVAMLGFWCMRLALRVLPAGSHWALKRHLPVLAGVLLASIYAVVSGLSLPTQRALVVVLLAAVAAEFSIRLPLWRLWVWALLIVLISQPLAPLSAGFWLSFAAVAILLWVFAGRKAPEQGARAAFRAKVLLLIKAQLALALGLALPLWCLGLPVSLTGPWVNLIAVPVVSLLIVPGLLIWVLLQFTPLGSYWLLALASVFDGLWAGLEAIGRWDASFVIPIGAGLSAWQVVVAVLASAALLAPRALHLRLGAASILLVFAASALLQMRNHNTLEVTALDVGQGLAVVISRGDSAVVFDTGMAFSPEFNAGTHIVSPYLLSHGLSLDAMIVSHSDLDHIGGAQALYERFKPPQVFTGRGVELGFEHISCVEAPPWQWRGVSFRFVWPPRGTENLNDNNGSCVLLVEFGNTRLLLPGDIEAAAEEELVTRALVNPEAPVDVLVAAHHGSKTSSSPAFIDAVAPKHVIFSAGYKNRYGHPHRTVVQRFEGAGAKLWMTADHGAVHFSSDGVTVHAFSERERLARRWF